jgi:lipopolysaccharide biosynthesis protein
MPEVLDAQVELARQYGLYGFCFQYEWRHGAAPIDVLLKQFLACDSLDLKFCICLNCSAAGPVEEGVEPDETRDSAGHLTLLESLVSLFLDSRYIRVDGKPLLIIRGRIGAVVRRLRDFATNRGVEFYLLRMGNAGVSQTTLQTYDGILEDPLCTDGLEVTADCTLIDTLFRGRVFSYPELVERHSGLLSDIQTVVFKNVVTWWDSEPASPGEGSSFNEASVGAYTRWLARSCRLTMRQRPEERLLFISAWNDWMHGAHLEPDQRFGYAYLHATANVLRQYHRDPSTEKLIDDVNSAFVPASDTAIILHCHHEDLIAPIFQRYIVNATGADLFVTVRSDVSKAAVEAMRQWFPQLYIFRLENRGRDIRPFLFALRHIRALGYRIACKVHTKKTPQAEGGSGELWRQQLIGPLLGTADTPVKASRLFADDPSLGLLVPEGCIMNLGVPRNHIDNTFWLNRLLDQIHRTDLMPEYNFVFPAGSMYWFRVNALDGLDDLALPEDAFEMEMGQRDGTLAHAIERLVILYAIQRGYEAREINLANPEGQAVRGANL